MGNPASDSVLSDLAEPVAPADTEAVPAPVVTETLPSPTARPLNEVVGDNEKS